MSRSENYVIGIYMLFTLEHIRQTYINTYIPGLLHIYLYFDIAPINKDKMKLSKFQELFHMHSQANLFLYYLVSAKKLVGTQHKF